MLKPDSVSKRDSIEMQSIYEKQGFRDELRNLESVIGTLSSIEKVLDDKNDIRKAGGRTFGLQILRRRRSKKKGANAEQTKEDVAERVKKLQNICKDLSERLEIDEAEHENLDTANAADMESRDGELPGKKSNEEERVGGERNQILEVIKRCAKILSAVSIDPNSRKGSGKPLEAIEVTESRFLETHMSSDTRNKISNEEVVELVEEIEMTESKFIENETDKKALESQEIIDKSNEIEKTEKNEDEKLSSTCCSLYNCQIIEAIENLLCDMFDIGNSEEVEKDEKDVEERKEDEEERKEDEEEEGVGDNCEKNETEDYFCGVSGLWNLKEHDISPDEHIATETEASTSIVTNTMIIDCGINPKSHLMDSIVCATKSPKTAVANSTSPKAQTEHAEEQNGTDENAVNPETVENEKREECSETEDEEKTSFDCDLFNSLCALTETNTDAEQGALSDNEDDCDVFLNCLSTPLRRKRKAEIETEAAQTLNKDDLEKHSKQNAKSCDVVHTDQRENHSQIMTMEDPGLESEIIEASKICLSAVTSMDDVRELVIDAGLGILDDALGEDDFTFDGERIRTDEKDKRVLNTVTSMDFIPNIEVIGFKKLESKVLEEGISKKTAVITATEAEDSRDDLDERRIAAVSTMDFIPRFEVVGYKKTSDLESPHAKKRTISRELPPVGKRTALREGTALTKPFFSIGKKSDSQTRKVSQKEYRRMAAKKRREQRRSKRLSKEHKNTNTLRLGTIQEAPEHMEEASTDSVFVKEKDEAKMGAMNRDTPKTLGEKSLKESPPPANKKRPDVRKSLSAVQLKQQTDDSTMSALTFAYQQAGYPHAPLQRDALLDTATSSLTNWTGHKSYMKEVDIKESEDMDGSPDFEKSPVMSPVNSPRKKGWFFRGMEERDEEDVECLSTVLSIPAPSSMGARTMSYANNDDEYINHYYDFGDEEPDDKDYEYGDDYDQEFDCFDVYNGEEEVDREDCYVLDRY